MILQETIEININPKNIQHYINKGYSDLTCTFRNKNPKTLLVKVLDLPEQSHLKVLWKCDKCGKKQLKQFRHCNTLCKTCSNKERKGNSDYSFIHGNRQYSIYKSKAKHRNLVFDLTVDEFNEITSKPCHFCGDKEKIGIDRKQNNIGYTLENSLPCCYVCNWSKRDLDYNVFLKHIRKQFNHLKLTP